MSLSLPRMGSSLLRPGISTATIACLTVLSFAAPAQTAPGAATVALESFKFEPRQIELRASAPVVLRLENHSSGGHSFVAPAFFTAAQIDPRSTALISNGRVEVPAHQSVYLSLVPAAGVYPVKCGHPLHAMFGMTGTIVVR